MIGCHASCWCHLMFNRSGTFAKTQAKVRNFEFCVTRFDVLSALRGLAQVINVAIGLRIFLVAVAAVVFSKIGHTWGDPHRPWPVLYTPKELQNRSWRVSSDARRILHLALKLSGLYWQCWVSLFKMIQLCHRGPQVVKTEVPWWPISVLEIKMGHWKCCGRWCGSWKRCKSFVKVEGVALPKRLSVPKRKAHHMAVDFLLKCFP